MEYILFALIILSGYHLFVENVIIPTYELELKEKLSILHDRVIAARKNFNLDISADTFDKLERGVLLTAETLPKHNLLDFFLFTISKEKNISQGSVDYVDEILDCKNPEIKDIFSNHMFIIKRAFVVGTSGWILYFTPFVIAFLIVKHAIRCLKMILGLGGSLELIKITEKKFRQYQEFETFYAPPLKKKGSKAYAYW